MQVIKENHTKLPELPTPKRVAAYCRVSTQQEIQHHSLAAQKEYYEKTIKSMSGCIFVGIYADQVSGRNNMKMKGFQEMLAECRAGKINMILVKSISRMGRNTLQFLQACDEFNALNIDVYFEVEKLHMNNPWTVRLLTIYASLYQNESEAKSAAIRWGHLTRFQDGSSGFASRVCYGYRKDENGTLVPYPPEAEIVQLIYDWHNNGASLRKISKRLYDMGIKSPRGGDVWNIETIRKILINEKYRGDVLLQKTYISDYFKGKQSPNNGELPRYLIKDHHESILNIEKLELIY